MDLIIPGRIVADIDNNAPTFWQCFQPTLLAIAAYVNFVIISHYCDNNALQNYIDDATILSRSHHFSYPDHETGSQIAPIYVMREIYLLVTPRS